MRSLTSLPRCWLIVVDASSCAAVWSLTTSTRGRGRNVPVSDTILILPLPDIDRPYLLFDSHPPLIPIPIPIRNLHVHIMPVRWKRDQQSEGSECKWLTLSNTRDVEGWTMSPSAIVTYHDKSSKHVYWVDRAVFQPEARAGDRVVQAWKPAYY